MGAPTTTRRIAPRIISIASRTIPTPRPGRRRSGRFSLAERREILRFWRHFGGIRFACTCAIMDASTNDSNQAGKQRTRTMRKPQYYILIDTLYQNSPDRYVGPFDSREEADAKVNRALDADGSKVIWKTGNGNDLRETVRILGVLTRTEAMRRSLNEDPFQMGGNLVGTEIPLSATEMYNIVAEQY